MSKALPKSLRATRATARSRTRRAAVRLKPSAAAATVLREIFAQTRSPAFNQYLTRLLIELCSINTTPHPDVSSMAKTEDACFRILERELSALKHAGACLERRAVNPAIKTHPNYSLLHFTKTADRPEGLTPEEVYAGRSNLLYRVPGVVAAQTGTSLALNAHLDVVAPYFPPRVRGGSVFGRGACDDKGPVVGVIGALKVLSDVMSTAGLQWNQNVLGMFVVEEETGGNGSLSLATDRELKQWYDSVLVSECTGLKIHPANRGAVWYRAELNPPAGVSAFELFAFVNEELEKEGAAIRAESRHPLFPQRPVQTCHGMIGPFGEHPSRICGEVTFSIRFDKPPAEKVRGLALDCLDAGLASYIGLYGDKTQVRDPATHAPMVARHYDVCQRGNRLRVDIHGAAGHMGSIRERDGAITKMAHLVRSLVLSKARLEQLGGAVHLELGQIGDRPRDGRLVLEGGQGFVPTHDIREIMQRLECAAHRGARNYFNQIGRSEPESQTVRVTYEKLHNVAFDGDPNSPTMAQARSAARACGLPMDEPVLGWTVSCDARLFATEYPGLPVLTFGPGLLVHAHSDHEQIAIDEIRRAVEFLAVFMLLQTGTLPA